MTRRDILRLNWSQMQNLEIFTLIEKERETMTEMHCSIRTFRAWILFDSWLLLLQKKI